MTDKQMEERIDEVIEFIRQTLLEFHEYGEDENEAKDYAEDCREKIEKLVEEVERETKEIDRKLMEKVADSDYQFGFIRGTQTSESLTPLRISEHEEERKKIRKEMMERFYN